MKRNSGNILFLILLAVVLFAALAYAVTSSLRGGGNNANPETLKAQASQIINYASLMEQTVNRMTLSGGCNLSQLSFLASGNSGYSAAQSPSDKRCHVFDPAGGGMAWATPDKKMLIPQATAATYSDNGQDYGSYNIPSEVCIPNIGANSGCTGSRTEDKELVLGLKYLTKELCDTINKELGYTTNSNAEACYAAGGTQRFNGSFPSWGQHMCGSASSKHTYCVNTGTITGYTFYHVLMPR